MLFDDENSKDGYYTRIEICGQSETYFTMMLGDRRNASFVLWKIMGPGLAGEREFNLR